MTAEIRPGVLPDLRGTPSAADFERAFEELFEAAFPRLFRYLDRLGGDPDAAADLAQEAFVRLYRRGSFPDSPEAWLVTVAMNLYRNSRSLVARRRRLLINARGTAAHSEGAPPPGAGIESEEAARSVRAALGRLPERDRELLLLRAEGHDYKALARILGVADSSVGTLLARAREAFKAAFEKETSDAT